MAFLFTGSVLTVSATEKESLEPLKTLVAPADSVGVRPDAILYYFHRTIRCQTCLKIEAYLEEALWTYFPDALKSGRLLWRPLNFEDPENAHFVKEFSLEFNAAILAHRDEEDGTSWINLEQVWDFVEFRDEFLEYIQAAVTLALPPPRASSE